MDWKGSLFHDDQVNEGEKLGNEEIVLNFILPPYTEKESIFCIKLLHRFPYKAAVGINF